MATAPIFAQPFCVQISDSNVWSLGGAANGTIALHISYTNVSGTVSIKPSDVMLTVVGGTLIGPDGNPGYCAPPNSVIRATYFLAKTGAGGGTQSTAFWTIPVSGDPLLSEIGDVTLLSIGDLLLNLIPGGMFTVSEVETASPQPASVGCYQLLVASDGSAVWTSLPLTSCH